MTKRYCDRCKVEIRGCQWWTLKDYDDLCRDCYAHLKQLAEAVGK